MDFTLKTYRQLLQSLQNAGFSFLTFAAYMESRKSEVGSRKQEGGTNQQTTNKQQETFTLWNHEVNIPTGTNNEQQFVILRHDVDLLPQNSLAFARIQNEMGIKGSYYFRAVPESWDEAIIKEIHALGHEVGYHYEDMDRVKSLEFRVKSGESEELKGKSLELQVKSGWDTNVEHSTTNKE